MLQPCSCGSGLRAVRCCAADLSVPPPPGSLRHLAPLVERAQTALQQGAPEVAGQLCLDVLELSPERPGALWVLYQVRRDQGQAVAAERLLRRLVTVNPDHAAATGELIQLLFSRRDLVEAEHHARNLLRIAPTDAQAHNWLGMVLTELQKAQPAEHHYRRVLEYGEGRHPIVLANLAWCLKLQGRMAEARALYEESAAADPAIRLTLLGWARLEEADNEFAACAELLDRMDRQWPDHPATLSLRAVLLDRRGEHAAALAVLARLDGLNDGGLDANDRALQGRLLDRLGRHDEAFAALEESKRGLREAGRGYEDAAAQALCARLKSFFVAGRLKLLPRAAPRRDGPQPIFVLGFPRSGTTLMEQMLSAHPRIAGGDELPLVNELTQTLPQLLGSAQAYPEALAELWMGDRQDGLEELRDRYLRQAARLVAQDDAAWFTDKMPLNETHLGLIGLAFPQSPLIHLIRHPLDIMVSCMANQFSHGFRCAAALETAATHYVRVMDLVASYRAEMPLRYLPVRYEDLVAEPEAILRGVMGFIGEAFDPACLDFHQNRRRARTASYAQVTEKLYDRSVARYRPYLAQLEPAVAILRPVIEQLGYTIDA